MDSKDRGVGHVTGYYRRHFVTSTSVSSSASTTAADTDVSSTTRSVVIVLAVLTTVIILLVVVVVVVLSLDVVGRRRTFVVAPRRNRSKFRLLGRVSSSSGDRSSVDVDRCETASGSYSTVFAAVVNAIIVIIMAAL